MTLEFAARVSGCLTLGLAAACLATAEVALLPAGVPELLWVGGGVLVIVSFLAERRRWILAARTANFLGLLAVLLMIGAGTGAYWLWPDWFGDLPVVVLVLPLAGPLLLVLALLKSFRLLTPNDRWIHQGLGLLMAGLGCVMADVGLFSGLLLAYLLCGIWHLGLAYLRREELRASGPTPAPLPWRAMGLFRVALWLPLMPLLTLPIFWLAPRLGDDAWSPISLGRLRTRAITGLTDSIDLNRDGTLDPVDESVIEVEAFRDAEHNQPKTDLSLEQRWRGPTLDSYENGRWQGAQTFSANTTLLDDKVQLTGPAQKVLLSRKLPDLGPGQFFLEFTVQTRKAGSLALAEPAVRKHGILPVIPARGESRSYPLFQDSMSGIVPVAQPRDRTEVRYQQVVPSITNPELSEPTPIPANYAAMLREQPVVELSEWTRELAARLASQASSGLVAADLEPITITVHFPGRRERTTQDWVLPRNRERVARALSNYLSSSGEYTYSFAQERGNPGLDPTLDFLTNVKHGPCTRYASGLALMLRSLGIPARVVLGFRGCEHEGDGHYQILASQAHAWVEALLPQSEVSELTEWQWLSLDPTPPADNVPRPGFSWARWWEKTREQSVIFWRDFVIDYNSATQQNFVLARLGEFFGRTGTASGGAASIALFAGIAAGLLVMGVGVGYLRRRKRQRLARSAARLPFYARLLNVLAATHGLCPRRGDTPREFAQKVARVLLSEAATADVADVPPRVVALAYRATYGALPLTEDERREIESGLDAISDGAKD